jgi:hypothetical protein
MTELSSAGASTAFGFSLQETAPRTTAEAKHQILYLIFTQLAENTCRRGASPKQQDTNISIFNPPKATRAFQVVV